MFAGDDRNPPELLRAFPSADAPAILLCLFSRGCARPRTPFTVPSAGGQEVHRALLLAPLRQRPEQEGALTVAGARMAGRTAHVKASKTAVSGASRGAVGMLGGGRGSGSSRGRKASCDQEGPERCWRVGVYWKIGQHPACSVDDCSSTDHFISANVAGNHYALHLQSRTCRR